VGAGTERSRPLFMILVMNLDDIMTTYLDETREADGSQAP